MKISMKISLYALLLFASQVLTTAAAQSLEDTQTVTVPLSRPGEAFTMDIGLLNGEIHIFGEDREDLVFEIAAERTGRKIITPSGPKMVPGGSIDLEIEERNNRIDVDSDWRSSQVVVTARIPRLASLDLSTVHNGVIVVDGVRGNIEADNVHGPITIRNHHGTVVAESVHGDLIVEITAIDDPKEMAMTTLHGNLELSLPANYGAEIHIGSASEEIRTDFEVELMPVEPKITRRGNGGRFVVEMDQRIVAAINGGGPVIKMETRFGDVSILKTSR